MSYWASVAFTSNVLQLSIVSDPVFEKFPEVKRLALLAKVRFLVLEFRPAKAQGIHPTQTSRHPAESKSKNW